MTIVLIRADLDFLKGADLDFLKGGLTGVLPNERIRWLLM